MCENCGMVTNNPKFCSRSCAAANANRVRAVEKPDSYKKWYCRDCGAHAPRVERVRPWAKYCPACLDKRQFRLPEDWTLGEVRSRYSHLHLSSIHSLLRARARSTMRRLERNHECEGCGWTIHVEIAHIKPMSSFPDDARISEVNAIDNLRALCPNCHWEFDNRSRRGAVD